MTSKNIVEELQFITGSYVNDLEYLFYLLLRGGYCKDSDNIDNKKDSKQNMYSNEYLESWFKNIK